MFLLGEYIPEPPALVRSLSHKAEETKEFLNEDSIRAAIERRGNLERFSEAVIKGLQRLLEDARNRNLDVESILREVQQEEKESRSFLDRCESEVRTFERLLPKALHSRLPPVEISKIRDVTAIARDVRNIGDRQWRAYRDCRRELETIRKARLAEYKSEWEAFLSSSAHDPQLTSYARHIWQVAQGLRLWAPEGSLTDEGFLMVWDRGPHHVQVEVYPTGTFDWFYRHRAQDGYEYGEGLPLDQARKSLAPIVKLLKKG